MSDSKEDTLHSLELKMCDPSVVPRFVDGLDAEQKTKLLSFTFTPWRQQGDITHNYQEWRIQQNEAWAKSQLQRGNMIASEDWTSAVKEYQHGLQAAPDHFALLLALGKIYHDQRLYEKARPYFEKILSLTKSSSLTKTRLDTSAGSHEDTADAVNQAQTYLRAAQQMIQSGGRKERPQITMAFKSGALQDASVERSLLQTTDKQTETQQYPLLYSDSEKSSGKRKREKERRKKRKRKYSDEEDSIRSDESFTSSPSSKSSFDRRKKRKKYSRKHKHKKKSKERQRRRRHSRKRKQRGDSDDNYDHATFDSDGHDTYDSRKQSKKHRSRSNDGDS